MKLLIVFSLIPLFNLLTPGLPVTHDGQDHVARIANFYLSLSEGNMIPRWAGNLNWGYGHPILMFLYPLPSYVASLFHALGLSFVDSTKLVFALFYVASVLAMYVWLRNHWGKIPGYVGAILYGFAPYRFVDLYVRGAIGEHVAFVFLPLVLLGLYKKSPMLTTFSMAGLILSHNAISLMFLPIIALYILFLKRDTRFLFFACYSLFLGFLVSAFFWIPAFFEGKYTLRDIVTKGEFGDRFVPWSWFFSSPWNYGGGNQLTKELGITQWLSVVISLFYLRKKQNRVVILTLLLILFIVLFLMTQGSAFIWNTISLLQKFQFPWRLLSVAVFITSVLGAFAVAHLPKKTMVAVILVGLSLMTTSHMWKAKEYTVRHESFYAGIYESTTDTGESSPIWSVRFMEKRAAAAIEVIEGNADVELGRRTTTSREYKVKTQTPTRLAENTLYFPGWRISVDGQPAGIEFQDPNYRGLMTFQLEKGDHQVIIDFVETKLRMAANLISVAGLVLLLFWYAKIRSHTASV